MRLAGPNSWTSASIDLSGAFSVHQAIYDLLREENLPPSRNQAVRKSFDEVWRIISARYKLPKAA